MTIDWDKVEPQCNYFAIDRNGEGFAYPSKPTMGVRDWVANYMDKEVEFIGNFSSLNWEQSLIQRPSRMDEIIINGKRYRLVPIE